MDKQTVGGGLALAGFGLFLALLHYLGIRPQLLATASLLSIVVGLAFAVYGLFRKPSE